MKIKKLFTEYFDKLPFKKIYENKYKKVIFFIYILLVFFTVGASYGLIKKQIYKCDDGLLRIYDLDYSISDNPAVLGLLRSNCLWVLSMDELDVNGDNKKELVLNTAGAGCASCHARVIYILEGSKIIFKKAGDDLSIDRATDTIGFRIHEPLRQKDVGYCCPVEGLIYTYKYNQNKNTDQDDMISYLYSRFNSFSNYDDRYFYLADTRSEQYPKNEEPNGKNQQ